MSQYSPGTMDMVLENRGMTQVADGYIAARDCQFIGKTVYLRPVGQERWERFIVADCSMPPGTDGTWEWMTTNQIVGEIDYDTAVRWNTIGRAAMVEVKRPNTPTIER